jgi:tetrahydromethanopterin S-methyltransferase subunit G
MKNYEGYTDREILVAIAEKVETLFVFVSDQKICNKTTDDQIRYLQINGAAISQQNARDIVTLKDEISKINTCGPAVPSKDAITRIDAIEKKVEGLESFADSHKGAEEATKDTARNTAVVYSLIIGVLGLIVTLYLDWKNKTGGA